ncbi:uncharacterized protein CMU_006280 [Cryptosporidium muris RN66]|uniref:Protein kinase domain-containing protein n=1 Tax=Cryptosporidium muris (strain RN66) TaxID=441375 RepID=B6AHL0_CRYMR|nr:uncharacterized protein CMU_006280 [Cryptosporidium muris RN66]EEA07705.1 hypothetical protein CMU_006280 [Cryptosporidium muris RN66]|eukprot:XP_002142054.1 hypothetical protein [Cryptosporidium muris RN66]
MMNSSKSSINYGLYGTKIVWDAGWIPSKRLPGKSYYGESWELKNNVNDSLEELKEQLKKLEDDITKCDNQMKQILQEMTTSKTNNIHDIDFNVIDPNDIQDPNIFIENAQNIKNQLEDQKKEIQRSISRLNKTELLFRWDQKSLPPYLHRIDAPWIYLLQKQINRDKEFENWIQNQWNETRKKFYISQGLKPPSISITSKEVIYGNKKKVKNNKDKKDKNKDVEDKPPQVDTKDMKFSAKLIPSSITILDNGKRFFVTQSLENRRILTTLATQSEKIMRAQWRYILLYCGGDFQESGILPLIATIDTPLNHTKYKSRYSMALISPYCENGNVENIISNISGAKHRYYYTCGLLHYNLLLIIRALAFLEMFEVYHGNIKPSNIYVSTTGFVLLLGDFMLPCNIREWYIDIVQNKANIPYNISPELNKLLSHPNYKTYTELEEQIDFYKNDVFCLAMVFLSISILYKPTQTDLVNIEKYIKDGLMELAKESTWTPEYVRLLSRMLILNPKERPRFQDLLTVEDYEIFLGKGQFEKLKDLFKINLFKEEDDELSQPEDEILHFSDLSEGIKLQRKQGKIEICSYM